MPETTELDLSAPEVKAAIEAEAAKRTEAETRAKREILAEKKALEARLRAIPEDFDPEKWQALTKAEQERERELAIAKGNVEAREKQLTELHGKELAKRQEREDKLTRALHQRLVQAELVAAISKAGGDPDLVLHHGERAVKVKETDEGFTAYVVNADGTPRFKDGQGAAFGFDDLAMELREKYPRAFAGSGSSGSGAPNNATGGGAAGTITVKADDPVAMGALSDQQLKDIQSGKLKVVFS